MPDDKDRTNWDALAEGWALAILFPAAIGVGFLIGLGADKFFGIGPWGKLIGTGLGIAFFAWFGYRLAMRAGDIGLLRGAQRLDGTMPTISNLRARSEAWRPWRAYAAQHLWAAAATVSEGRSTHA